MRRLGVGLGVLVVALTVEVAAGLASGSLALLSDAGHVLTDVLGMSMALAAILAARREATSRRSPQRTFGVYRAEVLAALANAVLLFGVAGWILVEAFDRLEEPPEVPGTVMLAASLFGLGANLVVFLLLRQGAKESLNVRAAYLEVLADTLGSVGVLVAGAVTVAFGWRYADPVVAVAIGLFVLPRTWKLGRDALRILLQVAPAHIDVSALQGDLAAVPGARDIHDVHVWTLTSGMEVGSVHLRAAPGEREAVLASSRDVLHRGYGLDHVTVQIEDDRSAASCERQW
ncbi:cation diffusion facilitator family transporter [Pseudonocardia halophobica]|uniref:Cation efflux system protein n=1 Tax=Pseudonocardia halophobica TaxID=29401 RepID=A0A9W6NTH9_9PSEU|nr:cation efflux system protein [Pseudonocardia halophobica]